MKLQTDNFIEDLERWYMAYIEHIKSLGYSKNTIELYNRAIDMFIEYSLQFQDEMQLKDIKTVYFSDYLNFLEEEAKRRGLKPKNGNYLSKSSKQAYFKGIRNFFNFINDNNDELYTFERYLKNIKIVDTSKPEEKIEYLTEEEVQRLIDTLEREKSKKGTYNSYRNSLLVKLMLYGGLRISEVLNIKLNDLIEIDDEMYNINIYAKGGKEQTGFISKKVIEEELEYFRSVLKEDEFIMKTRNNKQLDRSNAFTIVNNIYKKAKIRKKGLHILRHTLAMRLTQNNTNLVTIKKILRHSNIATTTIYAKATEKSVVEALKIIG
jgi:integrase/recombinase XerD